MFPTFTSRLRAVATALAVPALASGALAQQFTFVNVIPGPNRWTEGLEAADVDNDGDFDLFFADGDGFSTPGTQRQNVLVINQLETSPGSFVDESVARLGVNTSHARMAFTGDIDGDGWIDAMFANGFNTDLPFLYHNRGAAQPGFFDQEGAARGFTEIYSSASGNFGDCDNDGDLDVILCDSGNSFLGGGGDRPKLFINDGNGFFTRDTAFDAVPPIKSAHMDVQWVDIDNDFDLDFFGACRANNAGSNHYLLLNEGGGTFTNNSFLVPEDSSSVYEADIADLDGDNDLDYFLTSLSGFSDGVVRNDLSETGSLGFTIGQTLGGNDDNEVAMLDYDNDGDLDPLIGRLGGGTKFYRNNGGLNFTLLTNVAQQITDSTLDITVVDINNDGAYDLVSAQGESNSAQWNNKIFINNGPADTTPPNIQRVEDLVNPSSSGPWVVRAVAQDSVVDDGKNWMTASVNYRVDTAGGVGATVAGDACDMGGGGMWRFSMEDTAGGAGTQLVYEITYTDYAGNASSSGEIVVPLPMSCGYAQYGIGVDPEFNSLDLSGSGMPAPGDDLVLTLTGSPTSNPSVVIGSGNDVVLPLGFGVALIDITQQFDLQILATVAGQSDYALTLPNIGSLVGITGYFQGVHVEPTVVGGLLYSNGVSVTVCP